MQHSMTRIRVSREICKHFLFIFFFFFFNNASAARKEARAPPCAALSSSSVMYDGLAFSVAKLLLVAQKFTLSWQRRARAPAGRTA